MALTDFYTSSENAYRSSCPPDLTNIDVFTSGWTQYIGKENIYFMSFTSYAPKVVAEVISTKAMYGVPYTKAFDLQTLDSMIHGGYYFDTITKQLYVKCYNLAHPNTKTINVSSVQGIENRVKGYYIHRDMRCGEHSGLRWEFTFGFGEKFINDANFQNLDDFYISCLVIDPEPVGSTLVSFPHVVDTELSGVKMPGTTKTYWVNVVLNYLTDLKAIDTRTFPDGAVRYAYVYSTQYMGTPVNATFRYDNTATTGDLRPNVSNGTGVGVGNGWWIKVWGEYVQRVISEVVDIAALKALPQNTYSDESLRKVVSNQMVYKYSESATVGNIKATNTAGWWIVVPPLEVDYYGFVANANHCAFTLKVPSATNKFTLSTQSIQELAAYSKQFETIDKASYKLIFEVFPRTGGDRILDYTIEFRKVTGYGTTGAPSIYTGTVEGLPIIGNFANYLTGLSLAEGVVIDDLTISEIIESVS